MTTTNMYARNNFNLNLIQNHCMYPCCISICNHKFELKIIYQLILTHQNLGNFFTKLTIIENQNKIFKIKNVLYFIMKINLKELPQLVMWLCDGGNDPETEILYESMKKSGELQKSLTQDDAVQIFTDLLINSDPIKPEDRKYKKFDIFLKGSTSEWTEYQKDMSNLSQDCSSVSEYFKTNREKLLDMITKNLDYINAIKYISGNDILNPIESDSNADYCESEEDENDLDDDYMDYYDTDDDYIDDYDDLNEDNYDDDESYKSDTMDN